MLFKPPSKRLNGRKAAHGRMAAAGFHIRDFRFQNQLLSASRKGRGAMRPAPAVASPSAEATEDKGGYGGAGSGGGGLSLQSGSRFILCALRVCARFVV
jgi:hypothetical protein